MNGRLFAAAALAAVCSVVAASVVSLGAQTGASAVPRDAYGRPDLHGVWAYGTVTPLERPTELAGKPSFATEEEVAEFERNTRQRTNQDRRDGAGTNADVSRAYNDFWWDRGTRVVGKQTSLVVDPPDGRIPPLTPDAQQREAARAAARQQRTSEADNPEDRSLWERCITRQMPILPGPYNNNIQIVQTRDHVVIVNEMIHEARIIPLDGRPHGTLGRWHGDSRGRWEGDTLVVETKNFTNKTNFRGSGANLKLTERYSRPDAGTLLYRVTIDDPTTWTKPWTVQIPMTKNDEGFFEYACHEANYGLEGILKGARLQDKLNTAKETGTTTSRP
jgi:hypothetical protein